MKNAKGKKMNVTQKSTPSFHRFKSMERSDVGLLPDLNDRASVAAAIREGALYSAIATDLLENRPEKYENDIDKSFKTIFNIEE